VTRRRLGLPITAIIIAAGLFALRQSAGQPPPIHTPGHINCPPGSHGVPRFFGEGQRLERARDAARAAR
jgi:hypothetical protein